MAVEWILKSRKMGGRMERGSGGEGRERGGRGMGERGGVQYPKGYFFLSVRTFQAPFRNNKILCKEGKAGWGCICALRAAAAGPAGKASQKRVPVSAQFLYKPTAANVRQACRSHTMPLNI